MVRYRDTIMKTTSQSIVSHRHQLFPCFRKWGRFACGSAVAALLLAGAPLAQAADTIMIVTDYPAADAGTAGLGGYLRSLGYDVEVNLAPGNVSEFKGTNSTSLFTPEQTAELEAKKLVIVSSACAAAPLNWNRTNWNMLNVPLLLMQGAFSRRPANNGWGWFDSVSANSANANFTLLNPDHPITKNLTGSLLGTARVIWTANSYVSLGEAIARSSAGQWAGITVWPRPTGGGASNYNTTLPYTYQAPRALCTLHDYATVSPWADVTDNGKQLIARTVDYTIYGDAAVTNPIAITSQPTSMTVGVGNSAQFTVAVTGRRPDFQWYKQDSGELPEKIANSLRFTPVSDLDAGSYYVVITNDVSSVTSSIVTLTVTADTTRPTVLNMRSEYPFNQVAVTYSEPVDWVAFDTANYTNASVTWVGAWQLNATQAVLTASAPLVANSNYTFYISGVSDSSANLMVATNFTMRTERLSSGFLRGDYYTGFGGPTPATLKDDPRYPWFPSYRRYLTSFSTGNSGIQNYGARFWGYFVPPTNGVYSFFVKSDEQSDFYMNTNDVASDDPAGVTKLAYVLTANQSWFTNEYQAATNIVLNGGQLYYMDCALKQLSGGSSMTVLVRGEGEPWPLDSDTAGIPEQWLRCYSDAAIPTVGPLGIAFNPATTNATVTLPTTADWLYNLEYKTAVDAAGWNLLNGGTPIPGDGNVLSYPDPAPATGNRFYRARLQ